MPESSPLHIRPLRAGDIPAAAALLNEIIAAGGTTAIETPLDHATFRTWFVDGPPCIFCFVAEGEDGGLLGFQAMDRHDDLPAGWADIGTFTRQVPRVPGVGTALFAETRAEAARRGLVAINATIRADNRGRLAFYEKLGFRTWSVREAVPLADGTPVDRISKKYPLETS